MKSNYSDVVAIAHPYQKSVLHFLIVNYIKRKEDENTNINLRRGFIIDWKYARNFPDSNTDLISIHFGYTFIYLDKSKQLRILTQSQFTMHNKHIDIIKNLENENVKSFIAGLIRISADYTRQQLDISKKGTIFQDISMPPLTDTDFLPNIEQNYQGELNTYSMVDNNLLIETLSELPSSKRYVGQTTPEQEVFHRNIWNMDISINDQIILREAISFYRKCIPHLEQINLSLLSEQQAKKLNSFLHTLFNLHFRILNTVMVDAVFRVTIITDKFLENGKIRNVNFIKYPPLEVNRKINIYNRANSPDRTVMYASFHKHIAIRETKPNKGERIIISTWENISGMPFNSFPITNAMLIPNEGVIKSTKAFQDLILQYHPLIAEIMDCYLGFFAKEFVKAINTTSPNRYEYLYCSYFADSVLLPPSKRDGRPPDFDFIKYPSVAMQHKADNIAILPEVVDSRLKLIYLREYKVKDTYYDNTGLTAFDAPVKLEFIRDSKEITKEQIKWSDD